MAARELPDGFELYEKGGWVNIPAIAELGCWLNFIIGPRQVGKTYGTIRYLLRENAHFMYMRRTQDELETVCSNPDLNPFLKMKREGFTVDIIKSGKNMAVIGDAEYSPEGKPSIVNQRGLGLSLLTVSKIRGFDGSRFTDVLYDECIPETIAITRSGEGDGFLNAYTTINGNRELEGQPPLRCWLLANSNDITAQILSSLYLTQEIEKMIRTGRECAIVNGIFIGLTMAKEVTEKRKQTALMKHLRGRGNFYNMSINNEFAYNNLDLVKPKPIKGYKPFIAIGKIYIYENETSMYVTKIKHNSRKVYKDTPEDSQLVQITFPEIRMMYNFGYVTFDSVETMTAFKNFFKIK